MMFNVKNYMEQLHFAKLEMRTVVALMEEAGMELTGDTAITTEEQWQKFQELYKKKHGRTFAEFYGADLAEEIHTEAWWLEKQRDALHDACAKAFEETGDVRSPEWKMAKAALTKFEAKYGHEYNPD